MMIRINWLWWFSRIEFKPEFVWSILEGGKNETRTVTKSFCVHINRPIMQKTREGVSIEYARFS